ncbi:MAG TPA: nuclear transport factor 2 family protein [Solirubrobacteraceae bacterium]|nr:nuclear transport factor 2 family protein [Solirubrobacteraceae bacterium]
MSQGNLELLLAGLDAFNSGDVERILTFVDPQFEVSIPRELSAEPDTYRGHEGVRRYFETFAEAMTDIRFHAERVWTAGEDLVVEVLLTASGRQTGIPVEQRVFLVWTVRGGKALKVQTYPSLEPALASAGLPHDPGRPDYQRA